MAYTPDRTKRVERQQLDAIEHLISDGMPVTGVTFDKDIGIGDIHLLNTADAKINPAKEDGNLATIVTNTGKIPAQGQALAAASMPVVLPELQVAALTPPAAITGFATSAKQDSELTVLQSIASEAAAASTVITFLGQPADADTISIVAQMYEFDNGDGVNPGNIAVLLGADAEETRDNLVTALDANTPHTITAVDTDKITLVNSVTGTAGNLSTGSSNEAAVTFPNFTGGLDEVSLRTLYDKLVAGVAVSDTGSGLPVYNSDAAGADAYAKIIDAPARVTHYLHVAVGSNGAIISLDGGTTDHFAIPANTERMFPGLAIPASAEIHAKNLSAGNNYTTLHVSVW